MNPVRREVIARSIVLAAFMTLAIIGCGGRNGNKPPRVLGDYDLVLMVEPHSLPRVDMAIINNFACPHCRKFDESLSALASKYGDRLSVSHINVIMSERGLDSAAAHYLSKKLGNEDAVRKFLFDSRSLSKEEARRILRARFGIDIDSLSKAEIDLLERENRLARSVASQTPTVIIENQIMMSGDIKEIDRVIDQLLVREE